MRKRLFKKLTRSQPRYQITIVTSGIYTNAPMLPPRDLNRPSMWSEPATPTPLAELLKVRSRTAKYGSPTE